MNPGGRVGATRQVECHTFRLERRSSPVHAFCAPGAITPGDRAVGPQDSVGVREIGAQGSGAGYGAGGSYGAGYRRRDIPVGGPFAFPHEARYGDEPIF